MRGTIFNIPFAEEKDSSLFRDSSPQMYPALNTSHANWCNTSQQWWQLYIYKRTTLKAYREHCMTVHRIQMCRCSLDNKAISQGVRQNREQVTANPWGEIHPSGSLQYIATAPVFYSMLQHIVTHWVHVTIMSASITESTVTTLCVLPTSRSFSQLSRVLSFVV